VSPQVSTRALPRIDQWVGALRVRRAGLTDPERVAELDLLIEHLVAEGERDLARTLATVSPHGTYHSWGGSGPYTATTAQQAELYHQALDASPHTFDLAMEVERFHSGQDGICMDGVLHKQATREEVEERGLAVPDAAHEVFVMSRRMALFVSYVDGLLIGEDMYRDDHADVVTADAWAVARPHLGTGPREESA